MITVTEVEIKKKGVNQKTGKAWTMYKIATDSGAIASGFDLVKVGDAVELEQKGEFLNYYPVKQIDKDWPADKKFDAPKPSLLSRDDYWSKKLEHDIAVQPKITRQHSQSMALGVLTLKASINQLNVEDLTPAKIRQLTDYFDHDVLGDE